jgi:hypothetical protein
MGCPDADITSVSSLIVDAIGDTDAHCIPPKIMIQHRAALATVTPARIVEVADKLLLFPIDAEHGPALPQEPSPLLSQIAKLAIPVGMMSSSQTLAIRPQQEMLLAQQAGNSISPDVEPLPTQGSAQFPQ